jgi:hypothetical protein
MKNKIWFCLLTPFFLAGCLATQPVHQSGDTKNTLTTGQVQITLKKDATTQAEVLEAFGAPNLVTVSSSGEEVWTYQRNATVSNSSSSSAYGTIILFGASTRTSGLEQSSRTMTLIIKFKELNGIKRVSDFTSRSSSF